MIFYFSGTGNSQWVANALSVALGEPVVSIAEELKTGKKEFVCPLRDDEKVLFVFPVHAWGPAVPVARFIAGLKLTGYDKQPVYSVSTCGDECGYTDDMMQKALAKRGITLTSSYSVIMPDNYILMPGFNVDSKEIEQQKLDKAPAAVAAIAEAIKGSKIVNLYKKGSLAYVKSCWVYPLFTNFAIGKNSFWVTDDCISCGLCQRICPTGTITLADGKPVWADTCVQCVACIHRCPVRAIEYGKISLKKGRYHHPDVK